MGFAEDFEELAAIGRAPEGGGWARPAFGPAENEAHEWFLRRGAEAGLAGRQDSFGNSFLRLGGNGPAILIGSHLDTVNNGGAFDGAVGVVAALELLRRARTEGWQGPPLEAVAFRDEEGRFGPFMGSRAMMGLHQPGSLEKAKSPDGIFLRDAMADGGFAPRNAPRDLSQILGFLELHIEQGSVLEEENLTLGIVTAIAGQERLNLRFSGRADHAGTAPMDRRRDAFAGAARFATAFREAVLTCGDPDARGTIGYVNISPNQGNVVPSEVKLALEIRGPNEAALLALRERVEALATMIAAEERLGLVIRRTYSDSPVPMSSDWVAALSKTADGLGISARKMLSGANHDSGILGRRVPSAMVFVPSQGGRSHCPEEFSAITDIEAALQVMFATLKTVVKTLPQTAEI